MYRLTIQNGVHKGKRFPLEPGLCSLGAGESDDVRIDDADAQPAHASLELREDGEIWLTRGASAPQLLVNGNRTGHARLRHGDEFQIGQIRLKLIDASFRATTRRRRIGKMQRLTLAAVTLVLILETAFILAFSLMRKGKDELEVLRLEELAAAESGSVPQENADSEKAKNAGPAARLGRIATEFYRDDQSLFEMAAIEIEVKLRRGLEPEDRHRLRVELTLEEKPGEGEWVDAGPFRPARVLPLKTHPRLQSGLMAMAVLLRPVPKELDPAPVVVANLIRGRVKLFEGDELLGQETLGFDLPPGMTWMPEPEFTPVSAEPTADESVSDPET